MKSGNFNGPRRVGFVFCVAVIGLAAGPIAGSAFQQNTSSGKRLTLERLYSLPRLIGTEPRNSSWSPDGDKLAFLWNDRGTNFYDVWMISVTDPTPRRLTSLANSSAGERDFGVSDLLWQPDGAAVLFQFRGDVYRVRSGAAPEKVSIQTAGLSQLRYSPDGRYLGALSGGEIWVSPAGDSIRFERLTHRAAENVRVESYKWAPNGEALAFVERDESRVPARGIPHYLTEETELEMVRRPFPGEESASYRVGVVPSRGGDPVWMDLGGSPMDLVFSYEWSPDSGSLLVDRSDLFVKERRILGLEVSSGRATEFYRESEPDNVSADWQVDWAPQGKGIYLLSDRDYDYHIWFVEKPGATPLHITNGEWAVSEFWVSDEQQALFFVANRERPEERQIYRVELKGGEPRRLSSRAGTHAPVFSPDGRYAAVRFSSDNTPPDLLLTSLTADKPVEQQVTRSPLPEFDQYRWVEPSYVTFKSHVDGVTLTGRLTVPPDLDRSRKHPAILGSVYSNSARNQWGGRQAHPTWGLDQHLAQEGYVLLNVNFRGSWGHGKAFRRGIRLDYGGIDAEDLHSGVLYLKTLGYVDMDRVGIWGSSYGGLLTTMSLFKKPEVYRAGVAGAPATNVWHATTGEMRVMGRPQDHPDEYAASSAYTHAAGLEDPLMIIHGMRDRIVLFKDTLALVQRLMEQGKADKVELVAIPDSRHGWDNEELDQTLYTFRKLVAHFDRYLKK